MCMNDWLHDTPGLVWPLFIQVEWHMLVKAGPDNARVLKLTKAYDRRIAE